MVQEVREDGGFEVNQESANQDVQREEKMSKEEELDGLELHTDETRADALDNLTVLEELPKAQPLPEELER